MCAPLESKSLLANYNKFWEALPLCERMTLPTFIFPFLFKVPSKLRVAGVIAVFRLREVGEQWLSLTPES